jgi:hypothetical protein
METITDPYEKNEVFFTAIRGSPKNTPNFSKNLGRTLNWIGKAKD